MGGGTPAGPVGGPRHRCELSYARGPQGGRRNCGEEGERDVNLEDARERTLGIKMSSRTVCVQSHCPSTFFYFSLFLSFSLLSSHLGEVEIGRGLRMGKLQ